MSQTSGDMLIKCTCCGDPVAESTAYVDPDLKTPVCPECKTNLRWSSAWMAKAQIKGCVKDGE